MLEKIIYILQIIFFIQGFIFSYNFFEDEGIFSRIFISCITGVLFAICGKIIIILIGAFIGYGLQLFGLI